MFIKWVDLKPGGVSASRQRSW